MIVILKESSKKEAIIDVDDILWGLNEKVAYVLGYDINKITNFSIRKCDLIDEKTQSKIISLYSNPEIFKNMKFYEGVEDLILRLEDTGVHGIICSNCMSKSVAILKTEQLLKKITGLQEEQIQMNIISEKTHDKKKMKKRIWTLMDDSPYNIALSDAELKIMLPHPWNQSPAGKETCKNANPIIIPTFKEALDYICIQAKVA